MNVIEKPAADVFAGCMVGSAMGDRDTIGAMAAAVSGAYLGENAVPDHWRRSLENADRIRELARQLHRLRSGGQEDPE